MKKLNNSTQNQLAHIVLSKNLIDTAHLEVALDIAQTQNISLISVLISQGFISADLIAEACAIYYQFDWIDLSTICIENLPKQWIDNEICKYHLVLPIKIEKNFLYVAVSDPKDLNIAEEFQFRSGLTIKIVFVNYIQLSNLINHYLKQSISLASTSASSVVEHILIDAILQRASDIHCEPTASELRIRLRIDSILHTVFRFPLEQSKSIISRLKILANMDIALQRLPQDGRFTFNSPQGQIRDCRLSTCPTTLGEKIVIRLLDSHQQLLNIDELGLTHQSKSQFIKSLKQPQGLILVTGPTGSGKTQTLYTALSQLKRDELNIVTIENPVEIELTGINQVQVNEKAGLDFAIALRAFMRQDPDVIMVGEIRDKETAQTAIRAAQTGHLVLSTLHTNSAHDTLTRLISMGIPSYHLMGSLSLIIAQRLARCLCIHCKEAYEISTEEWNQLNPEIELTQATLTLFRAKGCKHCLNGYHGRCGIFEVQPITLTSNLNQFIKVHHDVNFENTHTAINKNLLWQDALEKVKGGITSLQEIYRVIQHD